MRRYSPAAAAVWTLAALAVQVASALFLGGRLAVLGLTLMLGCYLMNAYAAFRLRAWVALGAAAAGGLLVLLAPGGTEPAWMGNIAVNLLFLLFYLPMQSGMDKALRDAHAPTGTQRMGRVWAIATLVQRGASMMGFLPMFAGEAEKSAAQGAYTALFSVQVWLEMIALLAAIVSYVWMVRYLWRAKTLLAEEKQ